MNGCLKARHDTQRSLSEIKYNQKLFVTVQEQWQSMTILNEKKERESKSLTFRAKEDHRIS